MEEESNHPSPEPQAAEEPRQVRRAREILADDGSSKFLPTIRKFLRGARLMPGSSIQDRAGSIVKDYEAEKAASNSDHSEPEIR